MATQATINSDLIPKIVVGQRSSFAGTSPSLDGSQHLRTFYRRSSKVEHHAHNVYDAGSSPADGTGPACFETGVAVLHAVVGCFRWPVPRAAYNSQRKFRSGAIRYLGRAVRSTLTSEATVGRSANVARTPCHT